MDNATDVIGTETAALIGTFPGPEILDPDAIVDEAILGAVRDAKVATVRAPGQSPGESRSWQLGGQVD